MTGIRHGSLGAARAKGALYTLDASGRIVQIPVGADGQALAANSALPNGMGWLNPINSVHEQLADASSAFGNYRCRNIGTAATSVHTFTVPDDFSSLISIDLVFLPNSSQLARTCTITPTFRTVGGAPNSPGAVAYVNDYVGGAMTAIDIQSAFVGALVAGDICGITINNNDASTMSVMGTVFRYRRKLV